MCDSIRVWQQTGRKATRTVVVGAHGKEKKLAQLFVRLHVGHETRSCFVKRVLHRVPSDQREVKVSHKVNGCRVQHLRGINNSEVPRAVQGGGASRAREEESIVHQTNELKEGRGVGSASGAIEEGAREASTWQLKVDVWWRVSYARQQRRVPQSYVVGAF